MFTAMTTCSNHAYFYLATEYHLGLLKAKLAKYRSQLLEPSKKSGEKGEGFDVLKSGDARVALIGFPSVGKSTLLSTLTKTQSEAASYEFTTLTCIPGVIEYKGANIQLLDLPGIIEGASQGKGRGKQVCYPKHCLLSSINSVQTLSITVNFVGYCCCKNIWFSAHDVGCHEGWCSASSFRKRVGECWYQIE